MHIVSLIEHRDKAPSNAIIAQAVRSCADRNITNLVYSNFAYGNKLRDSLSDFKERNGFQRVNVPRYYVPMTGIGQRRSPGMHHKLIDRLPEPIIERLRNYRADWYTTNCNCLRTSELKRPSDSSCASFFMPGIFGLITNKPANGPSRSCCACSKSFATNLST